MRFLWFLAVGPIAGWLAGVPVKGGGFGLVGDLIVGLIGSIVVVAIGAAAGHRAGDQARLAAALHIVDRTCVWRVAQVVAADSAAVGRRRSVVPGQIQRGNSRVVSIQPPSR